MNKSRFALIEAVRGFASILVVWSHTVEKSGFLFTYLFDPGKIGVVVFFFISGYLVIPSAARDPSAKNFLIKRLFRLYPIYWLSLLTAFVLFPDSLAPDAWLANTTMAQQLMGSSNALNVYWTLTIEFCLYVIITICLVFFPDVLRQNFGRFIWVLGAVCLATAVTRYGLQKKVPTAVPLGLFCMFIGAQLRILEEAGKPIARVVAAYLAVIIPSCLLAYSFNISFNETGSRYVSTYLIGGAVFLVVIKFPYFDFGPIPRVIGDYSYGIYLFHIIIVSILEPFLAPGALLFFVVLVLSVAISAPLYYLIERPAADLGRSLTKRSVTA